MNEVTMNTASIEKKDLFKESIAQGLGYQEYQDLIRDLYADGKTTGDNHSEAMLKYTELNIQRMSRWDKTLQIIPELKEALSNLDHKVSILVLTEAWCGDAAHNVPVLARLAELSDKIELKLLLRDQHLELMDLYRTNGSRSIPKAIFLNEELEETGSWGPRPAPLQKMVMDNKYSDHPIPYADFSKDIQKWYARDKARTIQQELLALLP